MNEAMTRELLRYVAESVPGPVPEIPRRVAARARRRMAFTAASAAVLAAVVAVGAFTGVRSLSMPVREQPADQPPSTPAPSGFRAYSSPRYGYSIIYPADWSVRRASRQLREGEIPWADGPAVDAFNGSGENQIVVARIEKATTLEKWTADTVELFHSRSAGLCEPPSEERIRVGGEPARLHIYEKCFAAFHLWVTVVHEGSAYHILWLNEPGTEAADRALFDRILASFTFR